VQDQSIRSTILQVFHQPEKPARPVAEQKKQDSAPVYALSDDPSPPQTTIAVSSPDRDPLASDSVLLQVAALCSGDPQRVREVLQRQKQLDPALATHVIPLLASDEVSVDVVSALRRISSEVTGQLVDTLLNHQQPVAVRRRVPRILSANATQRAADGLLLGLGDLRFEVRCQCGVALESISNKNPEVHIPTSRILEVVGREVTAGRKVWEIRRLLDDTEETSRPSIADDLVRDRANRSLRHVFRLLSLVLSKEPLRIAFQGLHTDDENLRGVALEYLERILPTEIRQRLWPFLEDRRPASRKERPVEDIVASLMCSNESIGLNLAELRKKRQSRSRQV